MLVRSFIPSWAYDQGFQLRVWPEPEGLTMPLPVFSLSGNGRVRRNSNVLADATEASNGVIELLRGVDALTHGK